MVNRKKNKKNNTKEEIPLFPLPKTEKERRHDLQTLLYLLTVPLKSNKNRNHSITIFINIFRLFYNDVQDLSLIEAMAKEGNYKAELSDLSCQQWVELNFQPKIVKNLPNNPFVISDYKLTLAATTVVFCMLGFKPCGPWYNKTIQSCEASFNLKELKLQFCKSTLSSIYYCLWSASRKNKTGGAPISLRRFLITKMIYSRSRPDITERKVVKLTLKKLKYAHMIGFHIVKRELIRRSPEMLTWKPIARQVEKFKSIDNKVKSLGVLAPFAKLVLHPEQTRELDSEHFFKLLVTAVAVALERRVKGIQNYAAQKMKENQWFINEARRWYKNLRSYRSRDKIKYYHYDGYIDMKGVDDLDDISRQSSKKIPLYQSIRPATKQEPIQDPKLLLYPQNYSSVGSLGDFVKEAFLTRIDAEESKRGSDKFSPEKLDRLEKFIDKA